MLASSTGETMCGASAFLIVRAATVAEQHPKLPSATLFSALREWAAEMRADGVEVPAARSAAEILADPENRPDFAAGENAALIPLMLDAGRTVRANVTFDAGLLGAIDAEAERRALTRSAFLASDAREKIEARH